MKSRILLIVEETLSLFKGYYSVITFLFGSGLIVLFFKIPTELRTIQNISLAVLVSLCLILISLVWRLSAHLSISDRCYKKWISKWTLTLNKNDPNYLTGKCEVHRVVECLKGEISKIKVGMNQSKSLIKHDSSYPVHLVKSHRTKGGSVYIPDSIRKYGSSFSFWIVFNPPLQKGEVATLDYEFTMYKHKFSNLNSLLHAQKNDEVEIRTYEYASRLISYPINEYSYKIEFDDTCSIRPIGIIAKTPGGSVDNKETEYIKNNNLFTTQISSSGSVVMELNRNTPPMKKIYEIRWEPPKRDILNKTSTPKNTTKPS